MLRRFPSSSTSCALTFGSSSSFGIEASMPFVTPPIVSPKPLPTPSAILSPISAKTLDGDAMPRLDFTLLTMLLKKPDTWLVSQPPALEMPCHTPCTIFVPMLTISPGSDAKALTMPEANCVTASSTCAMPSLTPPAKATIASNPTLMNVGASPVKKSYTMTGIGAMKPISSGNPLRMPSPRFVMNSIPCSSIPCPFSAKNS